MRPSFYVFLIVLVGWAIVLTYAADPFSRIDGLLKNETSVQYYARCFLDRGPCPSDARAIKRFLPDLIASSCSRCSTKQKQSVCNIISTFQQNRFADLWVDFVKKYDPVGRYQVNLENFKQWCQNTYSVNM